MIRSDSEVATSGSIERSNGFGRPDSRSDGRAQFERICDRLIVCIASAWDYDPTSKHHLMRVLARDNRILWINYHGSRRPGASRSDVSAAAAALWRSARGLRRISPTMHQLTPFVLPGSTGTFLEPLHRRLLIAQIRRAIRRIDPERRKPVQVWTFAPDVPFLKDAFDEECLIYYCVDEYTKFEGFNLSAIKTAEDELLDRADLVVTTSEPLHVTKRVRRRDTLLVPHGVDYEHFAEAWRNPPETPKDIASITQPIFGFFGLIHHWIDRELIARVAALRPDYSFVLIGDAKADVTALRERQNVHLLGRRSYDLLPAYCAAFRAGLLPFARNAMTRSVNPIKMMEYLAAGLPVVSTPLPSAERFLGPVAIASNAEEFASACDSALASTGLDRPTISRTVCEHTWESRVEILSRHVLDSAARTHRRVIEPAFESRPVSAFLAAPRPRIAE